MNDDPYIGTIPELQPYFRDALSSLNLQVQEYVIERLDSVLDGVDREHAAAKNKVLEKDLASDAYFAIHNSDLNLVKESAAVAAACYAQVPNPIAFLGGLVIFLYRLRKQRVKLTSTQAIVLITLKQAPSEGWPVETLNDELPAEIRQSNDETLKILEDLRTALKTDGSETKLVDEKNGLWRSIDV